MSEQTSVSESVARPRKPRAWWQWVIGLGLIAAAVGHYVYRGIEWSPGERLAVPVQVVQRPGELQPAARLEADAGGLQGYNVLLVTISATRPDRLGIFGNAGIKTPTLDALVRDGVSLLNTVSPSPTALPANASLLTGQYPLTHGARVNAVTQLPVDPAANTLAETLRDAGYRTGAVVSTLLLDRRFGLAQGFESYDDQFGDPSTPMEPPGERPAGMTTDRALGWLEARVESPFFLWVQYNDPQFSYRPPVPYVDQYAGNLYDGELAYVDAELGRLLEGLRSRGLADKTLVVVTSDHGAGLGHRDERLNGYLLTDATLRVPLIFRAAGKLSGGQAVETRACLIDVKPTILSLLGVAAAAPQDGVALNVPLESSRKIFAETLHPLYEQGWQPLACVYDGALKFVASTPAELYDIDRDALEKSNIAATQREQQAALRAMIDERYGGGVGVSLPAPLQLLSSAEAARLGSLGYMRTSAADLPVPELRAPVAEKLPLWSRLEDAVLLHQERGQVSRGIDLLKGLTAEDPEFFPAWRFLGYAYRANGQLEEAVQALRRWMDLRPQASEPVMTLAETELMRRNRDGAISLLTGFLKSHPEQLDARMQLGMYLLDARRASEAVEHLQSVFASRPTFPQVFELLVAALGSADRADEATTLLRERIAAEPGANRLRGLLAEHLARQQKYAESQAVLQEWLAAAPGDRDAVCSLSMFLVRCPDAAVRRPLEAVTLLQQYCEKDGYRDAFPMYVLAVAFSEGGRAGEAREMAARAAFVAQQSRNDAVGAMCEELIRRLDQLKGAATASQPAVQ